MPSARSTASYNPTLTNYAQGLSQELTSRLADFMMPRVPVPSGSGQYKKYNDKVAFQVYETARAVGGEATRIHFDATDPHYNTKPHALEVGIDDEEREKAGDHQGVLERGKISTLVQNAALSREKKIIDIIKAGVTAVANIGDWTNPDIDPVAQIDAQIIAINLATGRLPNRIAWGLSAWAQFRNHVKVKERQPGAALIGLTTAQANSMFIAPLQHEVGTLVYDQTKFGKTKNNKMLMGDDVFIFYASPSPDQFDPSFAKCFSTGRGSVESVMSYREEKSFSDIYRVNWGEDPQVVSTAAVRRITTTTEFDTSEA
jgi:hypothetical protein